MYMLVHTNNEIDMVQGSSPLTTIQKTHKENTQNVKRLTVLSLFILSMFILYTFNIYSWLKRIDPFNHDFIFTLALFFFTNFTLNLS